MPLVPDQGVLYRDVVAISLALPIDCLMVSADRERTKCRSLRHLKLQSNVSECAFFSSSVKFLSSESCKDVQKRCACMSRASSNSLIY